MSVAVLYLEKLIAMTNSNLGKQGIPVLACLTPEPLSLFCLMRIFHNETRKQFTIALRTTARLHGAEGDQTFVAQYDADNLLPGTTAIDSATVFVSSERRSVITRNADPQITTLSLRLRQPCPLWCPRLEVLAPKPEPGSVASFNELVALAKSTTVHITFDYKWLHKDTQTAVQRLVKGKERLRGFPVEKHYAKPLRQLSWTVFGPTDAVDAASAPPTYTEPSHKRPRQVSTSTPSPHLSKRQLLEQALSPAQLQSPTECATSPSVCANYQDEYDFQYQAISRVVKRHIPDILKEVLPELIRAVLPTLFSQPSSFDSSFDSTQTSHTPELTPLGASLIPHILAHIQPQLSKMHTQALSSAFHRREEAALEFEEDFEFHKAELTQIRDDSIDDLHREATDALHSARVKGRDWAEELVEEAEHAVHAKLRSLKARTLREANLSMVAAQKLWNVDGSSRIVDRRSVGRVRRSWPRYGGKGGYRGLGQRWTQAWSL